ncbi:NADH dehydrogenase [Schizosaccharomyces japonicus yFS275]|uniref:NADH dehydrogenase n=1 Tax=Schizosaccharomyces japonicus (strain yFS275 / FY16936) TaxID=402676 RepID=B6K623_SCHJY|nr:NADH dehydrogenase [Schizosaccharomyces japonicus yFS275]EEB08977.2 NADH dehydrogenase [Schizosaccharomyces japonicus yFS275]
MLKCLKRNGFRRLQASVRAMPSQLPRSSIFFRNNSSEGKPPSSSGSPSANPPSPSSTTSADKSQAHPVSIPNTDALQDANTGVVRRMSFKKPLRAIFEVGGNLSVVAVMLLLHSLFSYKYVTPLNVPQKERKTLVILGSGWGAISLLRDIDPSSFNIVLVSPRDYFLFTPLLPSCTVGTLQTTSIIDPLPWIIRGYSNGLKYHQAECKSVDPKSKTITIGSAPSAPDTEESVIHYDYLVTAVGAENQTFGIEGVKKYGHFLKEAGDAEKIKLKIVEILQELRFNKALSKDDVDRLSHIVVVGGGPTGAEFAAEMQDFIDEDIQECYPDVHPHLHVSLIEASPNILAMFTKSLIDYTRALFKKMHIKVMTKAVVKDVSKDSLAVEFVNAAGGKSISQIPYGLLVWAAGIKARPITMQMISTVPEQKGARKGLLVDEYLAVKGMSDVYAIGDCAFSGLAATAQVAHQQGEALAINLNVLAKQDSLQRELESLHRISHSEKVDDRIAAIENELLHMSVKPFAYRHQGALAYIGDDKAVAEMHLPFMKKTIPISGTLTYYFWRMVYLFELISTKTRVSVLFNWLTTRLFGRSLTNL